MKSKGFRCFLACIPMLLSLLLIVSAEREDLVLERSAWILLVCAVVYCFVASIIFLCLILAEPKRKLFHSKIEEHTDAEIIEAFVMHLESVPEKDLKGIFLGGGQPFSAQELANMMKERKEPYFSSHIKMIRGAARTLNQDALEFLGSWKEEASSGQA
jgi:hypothetical protein